MVRPIITSILDNDLYKFTMQQAVGLLYPRADARYEFINRGGTPFPQGFDKALAEQIAAMASLSLTAREKDWLTASCYFLNPVYLDFLAGFRYDPREVNVEQVGGDLRITITGPWHRTILWEVPVLALVSELYFRQQAGNPAVQSEERCRARAREKALFLRDIGAQFAEFGTRRRFSYKVHRGVIEQLLLPGEGPSTCVGTSNVHLAMVYSTRPIGTQAHEWFMFHAAKYGYRAANEISMQRWMDVYRGELGIVLSDTFTTDAFFAAFGGKFAKLFDGIRHDSGDPIGFVDRAVLHYRDLRIDPMTKTIVFSDALDLNKVSQIHDYCRGKIRDSYGIGTFLTNDVGVEPLNIVIKMSACRPEGAAWTPTCKLSDDKDKYTGDPAELELCRQALGIRG